MVSVKCSGCGATFTGNEHGDSSDFDSHDCPAVLSVQPGESFEDYKARCAASRETTSN